MKFIMATQITVEEAKQHLTPQMWRVLADFVGPRHPAPEIWLNEVANVELRWPTALLRVVFTPGRRVHISGSLHRDFSFDVYEHALAVSILCRRAIPIMRSVCCGRGITKRRTQKQNSGCRLYKKKK